MFEITPNSSGTTNTAVSGQSYGDYEQDPSTWLNKVGRTRPNVPRDEVGEQCKGVWHVHVITMKVPTTSVSRDRLSKDQKSAPAQQLTLSVSMIHPKNLRRSQAKGRCGSSKRQLKTHITHIHYLSKIPPPPTLPPPPPPNSKPFLARTDTSFSKKLFWLPARPTQEMDEKRKTSMKQSYGAPAHG